MHCIEVARVRGHERGFPNLMMTMAMIITVLDDGYDDLSACSDIRYLLFISIYFAHTPCYALYHT